MKAKSNIFKAVAPLACLLLASCAGVDPDVLAKSAGMSRQLVNTESFTLTTFVHISRPDQPLTIYIEGDGRAWLSRSEPSLDPTPRKALGLVLASSDPAANVVYIARPCQFTPRSLDANCNVAYWTDKRFAPEVIAAINQAISQFSAQTPGQKINLVGYSGGAAVAVLIAASRHDVATLRTIAGNLDTEAFNRYHDVSAMPDSLNPISVAPRLAKLPQEHFVGDADDIVPPSLAEGFVKASGNAHCATITHVKNATHEDNWPEFWRGAVLHLPVCRITPHNS